MSPYFYFSYLEFILARKIEMYMMFVGTIAFLYKYFFGLKIMLTYINSKCDGVLYTFIFVLPRIYSWRAVNFLVLWLHLDLFLFGQLLKYFPVLSKPGVML